jgi:hypothetical protein
MPVSIRPDPQARTARKRLPPLGGLALLVLSAVALPAGAFPITIDTSSRAGEAAILSVVLLDGDFSGNNLAAIGNLATDGIFGDPACGLGCQGTSPVVLNDDSGLGEFLRPITLGSFITFDLTFSNAFNNLPGASADLVIGELLGLVDFETNLDDPGAPVPYQNALFVANLATDTLVGAAGITTVPIPAGFALFASGLALLGARRAGSLLTQPDSRQALTP